MTNEHELIEREWRNGWLYMHCSCGVWIGPFFSEDVAADCFDLHAAGRNDLISGIASPVIRTPAPESHKESNDE